VQQENVLNSNSTSMSQPKAGEKRISRVGPGHNPKYKTRLCRNWAMRGSCPYNSKCQFAHGVAELKRWRAVFRRRAHSDPEDSDAPPARWEREERQNQPCSRDSHEEGTFSLWQGYHLEGLCVSNSAISVLPMPWKGAHALHLGEDNYDEEEGPLRAKGSLCDPACQPSPWYGDTF